MFADPDPWLVTQVGLDRADRLYMQTDTSAFSDRRALARAAILVPVAAGVAGIYDFALHPGVDAAIQPIGGMLIGLWGWLELRRGRPRVLFPLAVIVVGAALVAVSQMMGSGTEYGAGSVGPMVMLAPSLLVLVALWRAPLALRIGTFITLMGSAVVIRQVNAEVPTTLVISDAVTSVLVVGAVWAVLQVGLDQWSFESSRLAAVVATAPVKLSEVEIIERPARRPAWIPSFPSRSPISGEPDDSTVSNLVRERVRSGQIEGATEIAAANRTMSVRWKTLDETASRAVVAVTEVTDLVAARETLRRQLDEHHERTAVITHELLQPLTGIQGLLEISSTLTDTDAGHDEASELVSLALGQCRDAVQLTRDLLTLSQLTADFLTLRHESYPIADLSENLSIQYPEVEWWLPQLDVWADPVRARQIVRNLVSNAHRYGGPEVRVVARQEGDLVTIEVRDTGNPIDPAEVEALFEAFTQSATGNAVAGSAGLGLNVSRRLAERMDGTLTYHHDGQESCFTLALPVCREQAQPV
jgi:signal transduction histidine kinase